MTAPILEVRGLAKSFRRPAAVPWGRGSIVRALHGIDLEIARGETLGLVGGSGSGKSTLARCCLRLVEPDKGSVRIDGADFRRLRGKALRAVRRRVQIVFQDPFGSLNPRLRAEDVVAEGIRIHGLAPDGGLRDRVVTLLERVGLGADALRRWPHEFSAGQRQRLGIARALATEPELLVLDEPVSALDVSVQAQVLNLLLDLKEERGLSCLFISHDLAVVARMSDRIAVLEAGRIVESAATAQLVREPAHPATKALLAAALWISS